MSRLHRSLAVPVLAASLLLLGACSTSTSSGAKTNTKATTVTSAKTDQSVKPGGKVHLSGSFCNKVKQLQAAGVKEQTGPPSTDPKAMIKYLQGTFTTGYNALKQIQGSAPSEIKADIDYLVTAYGKANTEIQAMTTYDSTSLDKITSNFSTPEAQKHSDNLDAYAKNKCGIDPSADSSSSATSS